MFADEFCARQYEVVRASALTDRLAKCGELVWIGRANSGLECGDEFEPVHCNSLLSDPFRGRGSSRGFSRKKRAGGWRNHPRELRQQRGFAISWGLREV